MDGLDRLNDIHILLPSYDQLAPRVYMNTCLCFPFDDACPKKQACSRLRSVLDHLGKQIPLLAGTLRLGWDGNVRVVLKTFDSAAQIPLDISWVGGQQFGLSKSLALLESYPRLADSGFPAEAFADEFWDLNNLLNITEGPVPVAYVRCVFIPKGLLLFLHLHHSLADVTGLRLFAEGFAAVSRGQPINIPRSPIFTLPIDDDVINMSMKALARDCSEYSVSVLHRGAETHIRRCTISGEAHTNRVAMESRTFIFSTPRLMRLRDKLHKMLGQDTDTPSLYVCLASLTFAHVYRVRLACEEGRVEADLSGHAKLFTPVDWRPRCGQNQTAEYFGNTVLMQMAEIPQQQLHEACADDSLGALARLTAKISKSLTSVDQEAVLKRDVLVKKVSDPRRLLLNTDSRRPHEFHFDTWRFLGSESRWDLPGVTTACPDAVRRVLGSYARPSAMILPAKTDLEAYEIQLALPSTSMQALCKDLQWLGWVDRASRFTEHLEGI